MNICNLTTKLHRNGWVTISFQIDDPVAYTRIVHVCSVDLQGNNVTIRVTANPDKAAHWTASHAFDYVLALQQGKATIVDWDNMVSMAAAPTAPSTQLQTQLQALAASQNPMATIISNNKGTP